MALPAELASVDFNSDVKDVPVPVLFERIRTVHSKFESIPTNSNALSNVIETTLSWLGSISTTIATLGIFSANEHRDDIATGDLKYLLAPFYVADFLAAAPQREPSARKANLETAVEKYGVFLRRCAQYELLGEVCRQTWEIYEDGSGTDAHSRRNDKVARFKREKAISGELNRLQLMKARLFQLEQDAEENSHIDGIDDETERNIWLLNIEASVLRAFSQKELLQQEIEILELMGSKKQELGQAVAHARNNAKPETGPACFDQLKNVAVDLVKQDRRGEMKRQVFRPSHILPTVTVEEQGRRECREMMEREKAQKQHEAEMRKKEAAKGSDDDEELYKQRAWDDWKDDHPRGYGNSKLRPCAQ